MGLKMEAVGILGMDVMARGGRVLRITVHQTDAGHIELNNLLEVAEVLRGGDVASVGAYSVRSFLSSADEDGTITLDAEGSLVVDRNWTVAIGDWLSMLTQDLADAVSGT